MAMDRDANLEEQLESLRIRAEAHGIHLEPNELLSLLAAIGPGDYATQEVAHTPAVAPVVAETPVTSTEEIELAVEVAAATLASEPEVLEAAVESVEVAAIDPRDIPAGEVQVSFNPTEGNTPAYIGVSDGHNSLFINILTAENVAASLSCQGVSYEANLNAIYDFNDRNMFGVPATVNETLAEGYYSPIAEELRDALPGVNGFSREVVAPIIQGQRIRRSDTLENVRQAALEGTAITMTEVFEGENPLPNMCARVVQNPDLENIRTGGAMLIT